MRIISQDGLRECNYDTCGLSINEKTFEIECHVREKFEPVMAIYSSLEKCKKAVEMLHDAYIGLIFGKNAELPKNGFDDLRGMMKNGYGCLLIYDTEDKKAEFKPLNTIWKFPSDEEIEEEQ